MKKLLLFFLIIISLFNFSCKKNEGKGGKHSIKGRVYGKYYNSYFTKKYYSSYVPDQDVYIIYGDDEMYGDKISTSYDGSFEFNYLNKGNYKVYTYSTDTATLRKVAVVRDVQVSGDEDVGNINVNLEDKAKGKYTIAGRVLVRNYNADFTLLKGIYYGPDIEVYIIREDEIAIMDRIRTDYNGWYEFKDLKSGNYEVYVYSKDSTMLAPSEIYPVKANVQVDNQSKVISDLVIIN